jgi:hypothetical protein
MSVLDYFGVDWVCERILDGRTLTAIAEEATVSVGTLLRWIGLETERSARVNTARKQAGATWDAMAEDGISKATTPFQLAQARELAHHYRWRASKIDPNYKDKVTQEHTGDLQVTQIVRKVID